MEEQNKNNSNEIIVNEEEKNVAPQKSGANTKLAIIIGAIAIAVVAVIVVVIVLMGNNNNSSGNDSSTNNPSSNVHTHDFGTWETTKAATCTTEGEKERTCSCGEKQTSTISKLEHSYGEWQTTKNATCTEAGTKKSICSKCNKEENKTISATGHSYILTSSVDPTCTTTGVNTYSCHCGEEKNDIVAILGHNYSPATCTEAQKCSRCNVTNGSPLGHTTNGTKCSKCGTITFTTIQFSGKGDTILTNINLPSGKYKWTITFTTTKTSEYFSAKLLTSSMSSVLGSSGALYSFDTSRSFTDIKMFEGPLKNGYIEIDNEKDASWVITIEAI